MPLERPPRFYAGFRPPVRNLGYGILPKVDGINASQRLFDDEAIRDGGAAMMAYAKCQFTEISTEKIASLRAALLKYCELDTLAMVMRWQTWKHDHSEG